MKAKFIMCINNEGYPLDLTVHKVYKVIPDARAEQRKMVRIVDDSGEDYLHSASRFAPVQLSEEAEQNFAVVTA
jgi:hypothetical protein